MYTVDLKDTLMHSANLRNKNLKFTDPSHAKGLVQEQIDRAEGTGSTKLPPDLTHPEQWPDVALF